LQHLGIIALLYRGLLTDEPIGEVERPAARGGLTVMPRLTDDEIPGPMAENIRLKVWLVGLAPIVVGIAVLAAFVLGSGKKPPTSAPSPSDTEPLPTPPPTHVEPIQVTSAVARPLPPPGASVPGFVAPVASGELLRGPPPEPIPELDALSPPKGSEAWTADQKVAYRAKVFADLDAKDRSLEREVATARRSGDAASFKEKTDTLAYLRGRRAQIDEMIRRHEARQDAGG
jgi:hypothetical protein